MSDLDDAKIIARHLAALEDDAKHFEAAAALFRAEFDACWERGPNGEMGKMLDGERALQLRSIVIEGPSNAKYNRRLAAAIRALLAGRGGLEGIPYAGI